MAAYPPGGTFFDGKRSFADVPVSADQDNAISTSEFLEAGETVTRLFDVLGSAAFKPVKSDMLGNITKIRTAYLASPVDNASLQSLVRNERKTPCHTATEALLWLTRGLDFTVQALRRNVDMPAEELCASFRHSYSRTLSKHHSFLVKPVFSAAMSATPYRKDFYAKLGDDQGRVSAELDTWLRALELRVGILNEFVARKEAKW